MRQRGILAHPGAIPDLLFGSKGCGVGWRAQGNRRADLRLISPGKSCYNRRRPREGTLPPRRDRAGDILPLGYGSLI